MSWYAFLSRRKLHVVAIYLMEVIVVARHQTKFLALKFHGDSVVEILTKIPFLFPIDRVVVGKSRAALFLGSTEAGDFIYKFFYCR